MTSVFSSRGEFDRAEPLLADAYKMYKHERWTLLATQCLVKLAKCQKQLKHMDKYLFIPDQRVSLSSQIKKALFFYSLCNGCLQNHVDVCSFRSGPFFEN